MLLAAFGAWTVALVATRTLPAWRTALTLPWLVVLATMLAAALAAPSHQGNALNMAGRMSLAFGVYLLGVNGILTSVRLRAVLAVTASAGAVVAVLALLEYFAVDAVLSFLSMFRPWVALVGSQVRAGGPLQYPTIASMFLEIAFAFALGLMLIGMDAQRRTAAATFLVVAAVIGQAIVFTFTRAGLITVASTLAIVAWLRYRRRGLDRGLAALAMVAVLFAVQLLSSRSAESLRLRLTTETTDAWFRAEILGPVELQLSTGSRSSVPVRIRNTGGTTLDSSAPQPFQLSYHWLAANDDTVVSWEGLRTPFPVRVAPGSTFALDAFVEAPPEPGAYRLMWDVEHRHRLWFSTEPGAAVSTTRVVVSGPRVATAAEAYPPTLPATVVRPGRGVLWRAAISLLADHPLLGVGPDNFRLRYGESAGLPTSIARVHSNNMYLEVLVGRGDRRGRRVRVVVLGGRDRTGRRTARLARDAARAGNGRDRRGRGRDRAARAGRLVPQLHRRPTSLIAVTLGSRVSFAGTSPRPMRIAFDGTTLRPGRTGVGYYTEHLLHHLAAARRRDDELIVVSNRPVDTTRPLPAARARSPRSRWRVPRMVWMQTLGATAAAARCRPTSSTSPTAWCRSRRRCRPS